MADVEPMTDAQLAEFRVYVAQQRDRYQTCSIMHDVVDGLLARLDQAEARGAQNVADERTRCVAIVNAARAGEIDTDLRSIRHRIESGHLPSPPLAEGLSARQARGRVATETELGEIERTALAWKKARDRDVVIHAAPPHTFLVATSADVALAIIRELREGRAALRALAAGPADERGKG